MYKPGSFRTKDAKSVSSHRVATLRPVAGRFDALPRCRGAALDQTRRVRFGNTRQPSLPLLDGSSGLAGSYQHFLFKTLLSAFLHLPCLPLPSFSLLIPRPWNVEAEKHALLLLLALLEIGARHIVLQFVGLIRLVHNCAFSTTKAGGCTSC